jgi:hypothetical protein
VACDNGPLYITGASHTITITGRCSILDVAGTGHRITVDSADTINVSGLSNSITYDSGAPAVNDFGSQNVVGQG